MGVGVRLAVVLLGGLPFGVEVDDGFSDVNVIVTVKCMMDRRRNHRSRAVDE